MNPSRETLAGFTAALADLATSAPADERSDEERLKAATQVFMSRLDRQTGIDLDTCIHCGMCSEACHFFIATGDARFTPAYRVDPLRRFYRREVSPLRFAYRLVTRKPDVAELTQWRELVYDACTACGRCDMICPMGINISDGIGIMREGLAAAGLAPAEMNAQSREMENSGTVFGVGKEDFEAAIDDLRASGTDVPVDRDSADVFVLTSAIDIRLFPSSIAAIAKIMNRSGADWTMSSTAFDAANPGMISGDGKTRRTATRRILDAARACHAKSIVVPESGHAYQVLRWEAAGPNGGEMAFDVLSIAEYIARALADGRLRFNSGDGYRAVSYHDPCRLGRHGGVLEEPRSVLTALGVEVREMESGRRENLCCGGGCGEYVISANQDLRQRAFELKKHDVDDAGGEALVTGCNNCRLNFLNGAAVDGWEKPVVSLAETVADRLAEGST